MKKKKQKGNPIVELIVTMKLAKNMNCSYEKAAKLLRNMNKEAAR